MTPHGSPVKAAAVQMRQRDSFEENVDAMRAHVADAVARGARLVLLPEYWFVVDGHPRDALPASVENAKRVLDALAATSREHDVTLAGNVLSSTDGALWNTVHAFHAGREVGVQTKIHPMPGELTAGVRGGTGLKAFDANGMRVGVLVCADVMYPEASRILSLQGAEVLLNPVLSPYKEEDVTKDARDALFIARAWDAAAFVMKAGTVSLTEPKGVGRSLVAAPWGLLAKYRDEWEEEVLVVDLDFAKLRKFRESHRGFVDRRPDAYSDLVRGVQGEGHSH